MKKQKAGLFGSPGFNIKPYPRAVTTVGNNRYYPDEVEDRRLICDLCKERLNDKEYNSILNDPVKVPFGLIRNHTPFNICTKCLVDYILLRFNNSIKDIKEEISKRYKERIADEIQKTNAEYVEIK